MCESKLFGEGPSTKLISELLRRGVKNGYFTVRLTISVYPHPPRPLESVFLDFFGVLLTLYYDLMCSETDFTQEKSIFIQLLEFPITALFHFLSKKLGPDNISFPLKQILSFDQYPCKIEQIFECDMLANFV